MASIVAQPERATLLSLMCRPLDYGAKTLPGRTGPHLARLKDLPERREAPKLRVQKPYRGALQEIKTMTVYVIADVMATDDGWVPAYAASVHEIVHKHGGKYLARSGNVKTLEGKPLNTTLIALLQFP